MVLKETRMTNDKAEYIEKLNTLGKHIACVAFLEDTNNLFKNNFITVDDIQELELTFFFSNYLDDQGNVIPDLLLRFSVNINNQLITIKYSNQDIINGILSTIYNPDFNISYSQMYNFKYDKPNSLQLYDSQLKLSELLNLQIDNENEDEEW